MTVLEHAEQSAESRQTTRERRCVLVVHGVGQQRKSDTLLYIGSPLVAWVQRWAQLFYGRPAAEVGRVELSFVPFDVGQGDQPPLAILRLPDQDWYFAEAWWAGSSFHPDLSTMLYWSFVHLFDILAQMLRNTALRAQRLVQPTDPTTSSQPAGVWQFVDLVNCVLLGLAYAVGLAVGYVLLVPLMVLAQIPIDAVQDFILLKLLQPVLTAGAGEFRMFLDDELQAANVRRRVGDAGRALLRRADCNELTVVAHSEGCVVSVGMLTDPVYADVAQRTRKLLTFGAGLNKSWLLAPKLDRLFAPVIGNTLWTDFWASYDPVPAGPLDPSRHRLPSGAPCAMTDLYHPTGDALVQVGPGNPPISEQVTNAMNVVTDHGGYFTNDEQVVLRLAAEISSAHHDRSAFWPASDVLLDGIRSRRVRLSALALWRDVVAAVWFIAALGPWLSGLLQGVNPWQPIGTIAAANTGAATGLSSAASGASGAPGGLSGAVNGAAGGVSGAVGGLGSAAGGVSGAAPGSLNGADSWLVGAAAWLVSALFYVRDSLPPLLAPISGAAGLLLGLPAFVGLCALLGVLAWAVYSLVQWQIWARWDTAARDRFLAACVASSQDRVKAAAAPIHDKADHTAP
ncbi:MAG: hypothetical protein JO020_17305 [Chloroflexi bacterium]|nr:hypothetical protein [Chloroflexota bacterium]